MYHLSSQVGSVEFGTSLFENIYRLRSKADIVHYDLKLQNIAWYNILYLLDFGNAQEMESCMSSIRGYRGL